MELAFQLKGRLFTLSVLHVLSTSLKLIEEQLSQKINQAPQFFNNTPMVIELTDIEDSITEVDLPLLSDLLKNYNILPVGFICKTDTGKDYIKSFNLPLIKEARATAQPKKTDQKKRVESDKSAPNSNKSTKPTIVINKQVRSGQQIYAPDGDLVVIGSVSSGAELLAEGNIHVYGPLRGRALAGINGDVDARIFCSSLEANIVSVAGQYKLLDETLGYPENTPHQIYLQNGQLIIQKI